ncbi:MAG: aminoglycoside N(3)-acetyltransferase [Paracoccaceae bacterium]
MASHTRSREERLIADTLTPATRTSIAEGLQAMGLRQGDLVLMHTSLSRLGWICGGEQAVLEAMIDILGPDGTLVMPGFSSQISDPADWNSPPVPKDWVQKIRDNMPVFDRDSTPTRGMGRLAELFRKLPDTGRSNHPNDSFLALGPLAGEILQNQPLQNPLGADSPLGRLHNNNAKVLLLGAGYQSCTSFHLAEDGLDGVEAESVSYPTGRVDGVTVWTSYQQPRSFEASFPHMGAELDRLPGAVSRGFNGCARLFLMAQAVAQARDWFGRADLSTL